MKLNKSSIFYIICGTFIFSYTYAADVYTNNRYLISNITLHAKQDTIAINQKGDVQLITEGAVTWVQSTSCSPSVFIIRGEDTPLISAAMTAYATGKPVQLFTDESYSTGSTSYNYCYLRSLRY